MRFRFLSLLAAIVAIAACSSSPAPDTAYHCVEDGSSCYCLQGKTPDHATADDRDVDTCAPQPHDCCAYYVEPTEGPTCYCTHDPEGLGYPSCQAYEADYYKSLNYYAKASCP